MKEIDLAKNYKARAHPLVYFLVAFFSCIAIVALYSLATGFLDPAYLREGIKPWERGDFWGGHIAAITGSITLLVVVISSSVQANADRLARLRESFMQGISHIAAYDIQEPGCEQALRLLDYYSMVACQIDEEELFLILNTVLTGKIKRRLKDADEAENDLYPNARKVREKVADILESHYKASKGISK